MDVTASRPVAVDDSALSVFGYRIAAHRLFLLLAPFIYAAYALLTPPFQTPDEQQHLFRAWQLSELHLIGEKRDGEAGGMLPGGLGDAALPEIGTLAPHASRNVVTRPLSAMFTRDTPPDSVARRQFYDFRGSVIYSPAGYIPQVAAIWIGKATGQSVENIVRLGRLLNAGLAIALIFWAIRITPLGALALLFIGLLPMSAAASASFGQDGVVIGGGCLLTAVGLRVALDGRWRTYQVPEATALALWVCLAKIFYSPLALIGGLSIATSKRSWRCLLVAALVCVGATAVTALWLRLVSDVVVLPRGDIPPVAARLALWVEHPGVLVQLIEHTYVAHGGYIIGTLFTFGWLNVGPAAGAELISLVALLLTLLAGDPAARGLNSKMRVGLISNAASVVLLISAALYLYSRPASDDWVAGMQGRYLLPVMPPFLFALLPSRAKPAAYAALVPLLMIAANVLALHTIVAAFYD